MPRVSDATLTSRAQSIPAEFERWAEVQPEAIAVQAGESCLTYAELDMESNRLARRLGALGVRHGDTVGVVAQRGLATVVAALGAMKAGGAYVPLDPDSPVLRIHEQLREARTRVVVTPASLGDRVHGADVTILSLDSELRALADESPDRLGVEVAPEDLFAVLFTSGSRGRPKGIALEHRNFLNLLIGASELTPKPQEGALHVCAPQFDVAAYEIWATLLSGGRLVCHPPGRPDPRAVCHTIIAHGVTWSTMPTSIFHQLTESGPEDLTSLRMLLVGGEAMSARYARRFRDVCPDTRLFNIYGPAEVTVFVLAHEVGEEIDTESPVPVGRAVAGARLQLLDEQGRPVRPGERGELYVSGDCVSRGYLHQPELTAERYVTTRSDDAPAARLYRSGDLLREREDGTLEIFGRIDDQVKVSGYRVEPGEVEAQLSACPGVSGAAVVAREDVPGHRRLVAYLVMADGADDGDGVSAARRFLEERLPPYMVPTAIVTVAHLPMNTNGKIDHAALPAPTALRPTRPTVLPVDPEAAGSLAASVARVFEEVLELANVGVDEDFFELGGNSLLAVQVLARLRAGMRVELPLAAVFAARTAGALAAAIEDAPSTLGPSPLRARSTLAPVPASAGQAKALLISELAEESLPYQSQAVHRILGRLDVGALERALSAVVRRHESLRTTFTRTAGRWVQHVHEPAAVRLAVEDLRGEVDPERALDRHFTHLSGLRLDPAQLPLARWSLARLADDNHALIAIEHHAVHDGFSTALFLEELAVIYEAELADSTPTCRALSVQYRDFVVWQNELIESEYGRRTLAYWREQLRDVPRSLELPFDRPRPPRQTYRGETLRRTLPAPLTELVRRRAREWRATPFMLMLAAYSELLARYGQAKEIVIGSGLANRRTLASEELLGMVVNTVALRIDLGNEPTPRELVERVRTTVLDAHDHQDVPFESVVEHLAPTRTANTAPLYQTLFSFHDAPVRTRELPGAVIVPGDARPNGSAKADLSVVVVDRRSAPQEIVTTETHERFAEEGLTVVWEYNSDLFERSTAELMLEHFERLLEQFAAGSERPAGSLALERESELEHHFAGPHSHYERDATIAEVFQARVAERPDAAALSFAGRQLSYSQLDRRANRLAHRLRALGVERGQRVGVCMDRSLELVVALLAVLKVGAAYVPLDPLDPTERLRRHLQALDIPLLLSLARHRDQMPGPASSLMCVDDELDLARESDQPPLAQTGALDPAYVMFTSGSTGAPKGVEVSHRAVVRLVRGADYVHLDRDETLLGFAPAAFDASTFELWGALLNGGRLVLAPPGALTLGELADLIARENVSTLWLTAGLFHRVVDDRPELLGSLRQLLSGGDVLSPDHVRRALDALGPDAVLINGYGPTEATTFTCAHRMRPGEPIAGPIPIGRPIANSRVYILEPTGEPTPVGVAGELCIGGDGVALGYVDEPQMTAERFPADPFSSEEGARMYRTGDRARRRHDGTVEFLGRIDRQLKIRGFRVEPGEVEEALRGHPDVIDVLVTSFERAAGDKGLAAYVVARANSDPTAAELRAYAAHTLPAHAVPAAWSRLERLPLTANGKIDVRALPRAIPGALPAYRNGNGRTSQDTAPPDDLERKLIAIWEKALDLDGIGPDDDFFDLGGHSLLAVEVFDAIERSLGVRLPLASIFEAPTVRRLGRSLRDEGWKAQSDSLVALRATGRRPPLFFVVAGDGNSVGYGALARRLGEDQPFFALQPRGLNGGAPLHISVERMAAHYVRKIAHIQPCGPYLLGGRCLGSLVAYEMARRLEARGQEVALLAVLDSGGPLWQPRRLADGTCFDEIMNSAIRRLSADIELDDVFSATGSERLLRWLSEPVVIGSDGTPVNRYLHEVYRMRSDVRDAYPNLEDGGAAALVEWAWTSGRREHGLTEQLLPPPIHESSSAEIEPARLAQRIAPIRARVAWRAAEAADLITGERRLDAMARRIERIRQASNRAADSYRAGAYGGVLTLIRSDEHRVQTLLERWHALDTGGVLERRVPGTHRSMLREPDVGGLADCVSQLVDQAVS